MALEEAEESLAVSGVGAALGPDDPHVEPRPRLVVRLPSGPGGPRLTGPSETRPQEPRRARAGDGSTGPVRPPAFPPLLLASHLCPHRPSPGRGAWGRGEPLLRQPLQASGGGAQGFGGPRRPWIGCPGLPPRGPVSPAPARDSPRETPELQQGLREGTAGQGTQASSEAPRVCGENMNHNGMK